MTDPAAPAGTPAPGDPEDPPPTPGSTPDSAPDPAPDEASAGTAAARRRRLAVQAAVVVVTVALAAVALVLFQRAQDAATVASYYRPSSAPVTAAREAGRLLFSYDHRTIDEDFAAAKALTTGAFAREYATTTSTVVRPVAVENRAVVAASSVAQAVSDAEPGRVEVLVFVNQVTTSTKVQGEKLDTSRVRMTLVERDGDWLVSQVEAL